MKILKIDVHSAPPTLRALNVAKIKTVLLGTAIFGLGVLLEVIAFEANDANPFIWLVLILGGLLTAVFGVGMMFSVGTYSPVDQSRCEDLLMYCKSTPEGERYRAAVVEQGRQFVVVEYYALKKWSNTRDERKACKELYKLAD